MRYLKAIHRFVMIVVVIVIVWVAFTGTMIQFYDNRSILTRVPATDPNLIALRESFNGPPNYEVLTAPEYTAQALPAGADLNAMLAAVTRAARAAAGSTPLRYVELRMTDGKAEGVVAAKPVGGDEKAKPEIIHIDAVSGALLSRGPQPRDPQLHPGRNLFKSLHGMGFVGGPWGNILGELAGLGLLVLMTTGLIIYFKVLKARRKAKRPNLFYKAGGWWRTLHRGVALIAAVFMLLIVLSGMVIASEGLGFQINRVRYMAAHNGQFEWFPGSDASSPLSDDELPAMLAGTLAAQKSTQPAAPVKVIRLRHYYKMSQGVVIAGDDTATEQFVYNTADGRKVNESEPEFPPSGLPYTWRGHQIIKSFHRGDFFALPGNFAVGHAMDFLTGLAMLYLSLSGIVMYLELWKARRRSGRKNPFWT